MSDKRPATPAEARPGDALRELLAIMARLRDPQHGCPWDLQQDFASIVPHTLEESYELAEAIAQNDPAAIRAELGDLLFQVVFYAQLGREQNWFDFDAVARGIADKLLRRHPHVFPDARLSSAADCEGLSAEQVSANWEAIKAAERAGQQQTGVLDDVPLALPALSRAAKLQRRASRVGFDWHNASGVLDKIREECAEVAAAKDPQAQLEEMGDLLFACVNLARFLAVDPEAALRAANGKFERRFQYIEQCLAEQGRSPAQSTLAE
ncbi:MAG TPA: nucleoside triphosphate pyrophosphohydrolase, partial [Spongiibacteraceae bacterium]|nr:nucleoside triphosphate pyrophosphohydrolase [Spongiibacteraceae bacterium]